MFTKITYELQLTIFSIFQYDYSLEGQSCNLLFPKTDLSHTTIIFLQFIWFLDIP